MLKRNLLYGSMMICVLFGRCKKDKKVDADKWTSVPVALTTSDYKCLSVRTSTISSDENALMDLDAGTIWRSEQGSLATSAQWVEWTISPAPVNYIKLYPARYSTAGNGFPVDFTISYLQDDHWVQCAHYEAFVKPGIDPVILPFAATHATSALRLEASKLGRDNNNLFSLQLADLLCGFDEGFEQWTFLGTDKTSSFIQVRNMGADSFSPLQLKNWNDDYRNPILVAKLGGISNIYAPNVVGDNDGWRIYFGGWDGSTDGFDRVSVTVADPDFIGFSPHREMISNGDMIHLNNATILKNGTGDWRMYYTTYGGSPALNKPGYATSPDGFQWTPAAGNFNYLLQMSGYPLWTLADVNGSNVIFWEEGNYHLYFNDFNHQQTQQKAMEVYHAVSSDGVNFQYTGVALPETKVAQDVKKFTCNNEPYYLMVTHLNSGYLDFNIGSSPGEFSASQRLLNHSGDMDRYITSAGWVQKENRLYGVLYGASSVSTLDRNAIFAKWLQKKLVFKTDAGDKVWADTKAWGPERQILTAGAAPATGKFHLYAPDAVTLIATSPSVTIRPGDMWQLNKD